DQVYWQTGGLITLCTPRCISRTTLRIQQVEEACVNDHIRSGERYVPANTMSGRIKEGLDMICSQSFTNQWCLLKSYDWTGSDVVQVDYEAEPSDY
ncbi:hypothetical protein FB567DRAFT_452801, partial [Paraphoma chrysanthemicola]